jgi:hypothetical protein
MSTSTTLSMALALILCGSAQNIAFAQNVGNENPPTEGLQWKYHPECRAHYDGNSAEAGAPATDERGVGQRAERDAGDFGRSPYNCWRVVKGEGPKYELFICRNLIANMQQSRAARYRLSVRLRLPSAPLAGDVPVLRIRAVEGTSVLLSSIVRSGDLVRETSSSEGGRTLSSSSNYGVAEAGIFEHLHPELPMDYTLEWLGECGVAVDYIVVEELRGER